MQNDINILSVYYGHNATVGLARNGEIVCLLSEERINRKKNSTGFPFQSLDFIVNKYLDGDPKKITKVVINEESLLGFRYLIDHGFEAHSYSQYFHESKKEEISKMIGYNKINIRDLLLKLYFVFYGRMFKNKMGSVKHYGYPKEEIKNKALQKLSELIGVQSNKIVFLNHHLAHAYAACFFAEVKQKRLIFTLDGEGDGICGGVFVYDNGKLATISTTDRNHSLGYLYRNVTGFLGMKPDEHEFKVMGLAPYAYFKEANRISKIFEDFIWLNKDDNFDSKLSMLTIDEVLIKKLLFERFDNVAGGLQLFTEKILCDWISRWVNKLQIYSVTLGGGVFMNVKASQKIAELPNIKDLFVVPSSGDESLVIGGCYWGSRLTKTKTIKPIANLYLGREFLNEEIAVYLKSQDINKRYYIEKMDKNKMVQMIAKLLASNQIVARCVGREEWGARALGNRSIIANANNPDITKIINQQIKSRDFWMPFAPTVLKDDADLYIKKYKKISAKYMSITFDSTLKARKDIPAALHPHDFSLRPQVLEEQENPDYYQIIKEFKKITGISAILNTSFNLHGEPNVGGPEDAIHTMDNSGLKYLVLGDFLLTKKFD